MDTPVKAVSDEQKKNVIEKLWLHYYNDTLLSEGMITEKEHRGMQKLINGRKSHVVSDSIKPTVQ